MDISLFPEGFGAVCREPAQSDQSLPRCGACGGQVCVCPAVSPHLGARVQQRTARPHLSPAAAEQTSGMGLSVTALNRDYSIYHLFVKI